MGRLFCSQNVLIDRSTGGVAVIDTAACVACGLCEGVCLAGAIDAGGDSYAVHADLCTRCGKYVEECPVSAITNVLVV